MLSKNKNSSCAFSEQIVSYIYNETNAKEKIEFETHLPNCLNCADEIAGFGLVRSSINEWRKDELFTLDSAALGIPSRSSSVPFAAAQKGSWADAFRKLFTLSPSWAAGFGALIVCVGIFWLFFGNSRNELVANVNQSLEVKPSAISNVSQNPDQPVIAVIPENTEKKQFNEVEKNKPSTQKQIVSTSNRADKSNHNKVEVKKPVETVAKNNLNTNKPQKKVQTTTKPTLSGMSEDEDNSLRLAELFEEIDTK